MVPRRPLPVNLPLALALSLSGCAPGPSARGPLERAPGLTRRALHEGRADDNGLAESLARGHLPPLEVPLHLSELETPDAPPAVDALSGLGPDLTGLSVDMELGAALTAYVEENVPSSRWSRNGVMSLTEEEIFGGEDGSAGLCEEGALLDEFEAEDGSVWEASYSMGLWGAILDGPTPVWEEIGDSCVASLLEAAGEVSAAEDCDEYDEHTFFEEGSDCRACLEAGGGDYAACVEAGECQEEAPSASWTLVDGEKVWMRTAIAYLWACAPDLPAPIYLMGEIDLQGEMPEPFDHAGWQWFCTGSWDAEAGEVAFGCSAGTGGPELGHTIGAGELGRVNYIRPQGSGETPHADRLWYAHSMKISRGPTLERFWATAPGAGQISMPLDGIGAGEPDLAVSPSPIPDAFYGRWGLDPYALRPDGEDASALDDTNARDWLATLTLKTATTQDGIYIHTYNQNRCPEDGWEGPLADGSWRCDQPLAPPEVGWWPDGMVGWWSQVDTPGDWSEPDFVQHLWMPLATLGSTGLPDPEVPGGAVVLVAGTAALADEDWDSCTWPTTFTPDHLRLESRAQDYAAPRWLWSDTYKFGKDPDLDLRVVLNTNQKRGFRPEETE